MQWIVIMMMTMMIIMMMMMMTIMIVEDGEEEDEEIMKDPCGYTIIRPSEGIRKMNHLSAFRTTGKNKGYRWCISYRKWIISSLFNHINAKEVEYKL